MNVQKCARCGFVVYPAEKINLISQNWHKACFHCEVCKMVLTANNYVSFEKRPFCQVHNPKNNTFTSVYETPININAKKQTEAVSENKYREEGERYMSTFHYDMRSKEIDQARKASQLASQQGYQTEFVGQQSWYSGSVTSQEIVRVSQAQKTISDVKYTEEYEQTKGKGSFPAMITPGYEMAKKANSLASKYVYTEGYEQHRGKGSFPAHFTPGYQVAKKAGEMASKVKYKQKYELEKGKVSTDAGAAEFALAKEHADHLSQHVYTEGYEQQKGKGSFPAMITPAYQMAKKAHDMASNVEYKKDLETTKGHSINYCETPQFKNVSKIAKYTSDNKYKEKYTNHMKGHYEGGGIDKTTMHAMNVRKLASDIAYKSEYEQEKNVQGEYNYPANITPSYQSQKKLEPLKDLNYKANYEKTKNQYTLSQDTPGFKNAKANAELVSDIKYKENWEKNKSKACDFGLDTLTLKAAKASTDLASNIKYKESHMKNKDKAIGMDVSDSKTLHSLQVAKLSSEVAYKKGSKETQSKCHLPLDMMNFSHAKKAQALASDLDYRKKLHDYTVLPDDITVQQAKKAYQLQSDNSGFYTFMQKKYRQKVDRVKFTQVADTPSIKHAKKSQELQSDLAYKAATELLMHQYTMSKDEPLFKQAKANAELLSGKSYKSSWEEQREKGFELGMDSVSILTAKATRDLASDVKYKQEYEMTKGKMIGVKAVSDDSQMAHSSLATKLQSDLNYRKEHKDTKTKYSASLDMMTLTHAKKAQELATETNYKTFLHKYTNLPTDMKLEWAKKAYGLHSDRKYRSDLNWMKGVGWETTGSLDVQQARKATDLVSERLYRKKGENEMHKYTLSGDLPEHVQAKINAVNISESRYKESWTKMKDAGYKLRLDAIPFQSAKSSADIFSDIKYRKDSSKAFSQFHLPMDMLDVLHAKKAQSLISDQDYKLILHKYTTLPDDIKVMAAKKAYELQSEKKYRQQPYSFKHTSVTDSPDMVHAKISGRFNNERLYKEKGENFRHNYTSTAERPEITQAKINAANFSDVKYKESWHTLRAQGYKLSMKDIPFQAAKASTSIASDYQYKHNHVLDKGKHLGARSVLEDSHLMHCLEMGRLQSDQNYRKDAMSISSHYQLPLDMVNLVHAKKAQALASDQDYKTHMHSYTTLPDDMKVQWAKKAYELQSQNLYKADLNFMKGVAWDSVGAAQHEYVKKAGELISDKKYRQHPDSLKFTQVADSPDIMHAKNSYMQCSERMYRSADSKSTHKYTLHHDHPDFIRAKINAQQISDKAYKLSGEQVKAAGYDLRLDAIPFQTAKTSREIASDFRYKEAFVKDKGHQVGLLSVEDDPKMRHSRAVGKLQSNNVYKKQSQETRSQFKIHADQPGFLQAKKSQAQLSNVNYRQKHQDYTSYPDQLNVQHAKQAYQLQSDVNYKSDLNWIKGAGWTPPGSHKVEMARRAAELGLAEGVTTDEAIAQYQELLMLQRQEQQHQSTTEQTETTQEFQQPGVNPDAMEILHVKRKKTIHTAFKQAKTTKSITSQSVATHSSARGDTDSSQISAKPARTTINQFGPTSKLSVTKTSVLNTRQLD
ncbi:Nebulin-related-anchoring protein [Triplophysa tibetana]|uniref:Nebulin-related-anchoring protein n=1 Tax=Triplophysa tibetana TaxID=1572043 RepID=A0A5A9PS85_9TELE|nr:Nebulin-related-anchoring protein [Triplophysa tibetana]